LEKIFFCFPDPHFKAKNHRRRIVNDTLLSEYAYLLEENGRLYCITDVEELHKWHVERCTSHVAFERIPDEEVYGIDPAVKAMIETTEEGKKVERMHGKKYYAVFRRRTDDEIAIASVSFMKSVF
jgi:tRNA (guanine-N7-)-methyltransferase